jgi:argininosuccinate lyase
MAKGQKTTVGHIDEDVLQFTAARDVELDHQLVEVDCLGSAAHVTMLSRIPVKPKLFTAAQRQDVIRELRAIMRDGRDGRFRITLKDQDVHLAVERVLTSRLGDLGKRIHTGRSRNDQVAVDLRLYAKQELPAMVREGADLVRALLRLAGKGITVPMVGRTHLQKAMPSSVGLWASAHAESVLDDLVLLINAYEMNDQCPLGSAAGYGVPLPLDRELTADLLGFSRVSHNVLYASCARGKIESIVLSALCQAMISVSRLAEDLILYSMPEFGYFQLPAEYCTGSSIMPQKNNPDVLELVRARTATMIGTANGLLGILKALPSGYNRDLQESKEGLLTGLATVRRVYRIMSRLIDGVRMDRKALAAGFSPDVFATDRALQLVAEGMPFRDAYAHVKAHLDELEDLDALPLIAAKTSVGDTGGLALDILKQRRAGAVDWSRSEVRALNKALSKLLGVTYPDGV